LGKSGVTGLRHGIGATSHHHRGLEAVLKKSVAAKMFQDEGIFPII
jgi:hypothetical protein